MPIPQNNVKTTLAKITLDALTAFAECHQNEQFYGFAFDCNAEYCQVLLCLNTEENLQNRARKLKETPSKPFLPNFDKMMEEKYGVMPKPLYHDKSASELIEYLRWETGDWKYQGFYSCNDNPAWAAFATAISEEYEGDSDREMFLEAVCQVIPEVRSAFDRLNRTRDFRALVIDHDESVEIAWKRLERVQSKAPTLGLNPVPAAIILNTSLNERRII